MWNGTLGKKDVLRHWLLWLTHVLVVVLAGSNAWTVLARPGPFEMLTWVFLKIANENEQLFSSASSVQIR
jgi:hypothetical protein